jgi:hypothetical protein
MLKNKSCLEVKSQSGKLFNFLCDNDASLGECYDVLQCLVKFILDKMKEQESPDLEKEKEDG